jgi:hypothetical protein
MYVVVVLVAAVRIVEYCQLISYTFTYTVYCGWLVGWLALLL